MSDSEKSAGSVVTSDQRGAAGNPAASLAQLHAAQVQIEALSATLHQIAGMVPCIIATLTRAADSEDTRLALCAADSLAIIGVLADTAASRHGAVCVNGTSVADWLGGDKLRQAVTAAGWQQ